MTAFTMRQRLVPDHLLGRITSLYRTVADGSEALGALVGGVFAAIAGIRATVLVGALPSPPPWSCSAGTTAAPPQTRKCQVPAAHRLPWLR
jgi:hypothetical protein